MGKKKKTIVIVLVIILLVGVLSGVSFYLVFNKHNKLNFDYEKGKLALQKVETAQYVPDIDKYNQAVSAIQPNGVSPMSNEEKTPVEKFVDMVNSYATIKSEGAGKSGGYDIFEIKEELFYVINAVPAFNQWFRMPTMRADEGYINIPYYEWWAYYLDYNQETNTLSVTRVCWATGDGDYQVMKTNYNYNEEGDEVVECLIYSVHCSNYDTPTGGKTGHYNSNVDDYVDLGYQYLRNVKDKSVVKYYQFNSNDWNHNDLEWTKNHLYGTSQRLVLVDYDGYVNFRMTELGRGEDAGNWQGYNHIWNNVDYANQADIPFDTTDDLIKMLTECFGLKDEDVAGLSLDEYLDAAIKNFVDNNELKCDWATIYQESDAAIEMDRINGPLYGKIIGICNLSANLTMDENIYFSAYAMTGDFLGEKHRLDLDKEYSLSLALKSRETGELYIITTQYQKIQDDSIKTQQNLSASDFQIDENGTYDFVIVLMVKENDGDVLLLDTLTTPFCNESYCKFEIPDTVDDTGVTYQYSIKSVDNKLVITVTSEN